MNPLFSIPTPAQRFPGLERAKTRFAASERATLPSPAFLLRSVLQWLPGVLQWQIFRSPQAGCDSRLDRTGKPSRVGPISNNRACGLPGPLPDVLNKHVLPPAIRRLLPDFPSTKNEDTKLRCSAALFFTPSKCWASRNSKATAKPYASRPGFGGNGLQESHPKPNPGLPPVGGAAIEGSRPRAGRTESLRIMRTKKMLVVGTLLALALVVGLLAFGFMSWQSAALYVLGIQTVAIAISERQPVLYLASLTQEQLKEFEEILKELKAPLGEVRQFLKEFPDLKQHVDTLRRGGLARGGSPSLPGQVSDDCAEWFGSLAILGLHKREKLEGPNRERLLARSLNVLRLETRTALSSSDIPLPTQYSGQVVALVGMFGTARKYGTVFPLGAATVKLPKLKTDPTFGLLAQSTAISEKSPQTEWVTFTPEKFGGLVRLPNELDEDSIVPLGRFIAEYAARQIAYVEDWNFWRGTGAASGVNGTAEGLTKSVATDSKTTTSTGLGSPSEFTVTHFRTLRGVCDAGALRRGAYFLHPSFEALLATFNTSGNKPFNPAAQITGSGANPMEITPTLDGYPVRWIDVMPVYSTSDVLSTVHVLFGDASYNYLGVRGNMRFDTSMDAAFETDEILVRAIERLTIGKMATGCMGGLITAAA